MTTAEAIILIGLFVIGLILTICVYIWKHITLGMAGAVYWVVIGLYTTILSEGNLLTMQGGIGLLELMLGIMTGTLPFVLKTKPEVPPQLSGGEKLEMRMKKYGNNTNATIIRKPVKPWYEDDE